MSAKRPAHPERAFGLSVGGVLCAIAAVLAWRGRAGRAEIAAAAGVLLAFLGVCYPQALRWPSARWWRFSRWLGHVNALVLLTLIFALVLTPLGILWRAIGRDPLTRERKRWRGWSEYPARYRDRLHYRRMF